jgi:glycosyltransferase involved in cell wall biosynthesis
MSLRIAVIHYHLRPGGVTSVIARAASALAGEQVSMAVLCGDAAGARLAGPVVVVPHLDYAGGGRAPGLAEDLIEAATRALGGRPDVWHVHNHSIGKSAAVPRAVAELARRGERLLLQIHDFAEDGRPANYRLLREELASEAGAGFDRLLYPTGARVHYALLNRHDRDVLVKAGADPGRTHVLANPVSLEPVPPDVDRVPGLFVYPTRAIRRKNLGEFLLWAALAPRDTRWQTTIEPKTAADRPAYERWRAVARELRLPVDFAVALEHPRPMAEVLARAEAVVTTSVAEGFGLSFLEPWLAGRAVAGRNLPEITGDFVDEGVRLESLYARLDVPLDWVGSTRFRTAVGEGLRALRAAYGRVASEADVESACAAALRGTSVDFGRLDEAMQEDVLRRVAAGETPDLHPSKLATAVPHPAIAANASAVRRAYGEDRHARRLAGLYRRIMDEPAATGEGPDAARILDLFLTPERFMLLRT